MIPLDGRRGLAANDVTVAVRCSDGTLWFGTGCGMGCYRPGEGAVAVEFAHDQLQAGVIHGLLADSLDNVWAATNAGIVRYNPAAHRSVAYGASYGLEVVEFSDGAYFYDRRAGKLLFGGINGLVVVSGGESLAPGVYAPGAVSGCDHRRHGSQHFEADAQGQTGAYHRPRGFRSFDRGAGLYQRRQLFVPV